MRLACKRLPFLLAIALVGCNTAPPNSAEVVEPAGNAKETTEKAIEKATAPEIIQKLPAQSGVDTKQKESLPKAIAPALQPGIYCYEFENDMGSEAVRLVIDNSDRVTGDVQGVVTNEAEGYYTSYRQKVDGTIDGSSLNVDVATWIEYDQQNKQETWRVTPKSLTMNRDALPAADCGPVSKAFQNENGLEAKDLTSSATNVRRFPVFFDAGKNGTTVSDAVVRGDRDVYILSAQGGQQMDLFITSVEDNAVFDVVDPSGIILGTEMTDGRIFLPHTGDYEIIVGGTRGNASYDLSIDIE